MHVYACMHWLYICLGKKTLKNDHSMPLRQWNDLIKKVNEIIEICDGIGGNLVMKFFKFYQNFTSVMDVTNR